MSERRSALSISLVIGGGINGAGIARDAAGRGLSVLLCEKDDLAQGTSSRSGKLVHGGLRYLEYYEFRLVREALIEREVLLQAAPHIIWPMRFVLPHSPEQRPAWLVRLGPVPLRPSRRPQAAARHPQRSTCAPRPEGAPIKRRLQARLRIFRLLGRRCPPRRAQRARRAGARRRHPHAHGRASRRGARTAIGIVELKDAETGGRDTVKARVLVNAAGPWVEDVLGRVARLNSSRRVRLVKGSHIVVPKFWEGRQAYLLQNNDKRVIFVNPYEDDLA